MDRKTFPTPGTHPGVLPAGIDFRPYLVIPDMVLLLRISVSIFPSNLYVYYPKWLQSNTFNYSITYYHCWKMILKIKNALAGTPTTAISLYTSLQMSKLFYIWMSIYLITKIAIKRIFSLLICNAVKCTFCPPQHVGVGNYNPLYLVLRSKTGVF